MTHDLIKERSADRTEKRIHVALPVRVTFFDDDTKPRLEMACTYDISAHGARVTGLRSVKEAGQILVVERGRSRAYCRVVWIGEASSSLNGQMGIQCVEAEKSLWASELSDMEQLYDPILRDTALYKLSSQLNYPAGNRRKYPRFAAEGVAELLQRVPSVGRFEGDLIDVSEVGCLVSTNSLVLPGTDLKLVVSFANYDLSFKGQVRHAAVDVGLGIEFREVRKGDRAILQYLVTKLAQKNANAARPEKLKGKSVAVS